MPKLSDCFVVSHHRSRGVGSALVARGESIVAAAGHARLYVGVDPVDNPGWHDWFVRRGYRPLMPTPVRKQETRHDEQGRPSDVLTWRLELEKVFE